MHRHHRNPAWKWQTRLFLTSPRLGEGAALEDGRQRPRPQRGLPGAGGAAGRERLGRAVSGAPSGSQCLQELPAVPARPRQPQPRPLKETREPRRAEPTGGLQRSHGAAARGRERTAGAAQPRSRVGGGARWAARQLGTAEPSAPIPHRSAPPEPTAFGRCGMRLREPPGTESCLPGRPSSARSRAAARCGNGRGPEAVVRRPLRSARPGAPSPRPGPALTGPRRAGGSGLSAPPAPPPSRAPPRARAAPPGLGGREGERLRVRVRAVRGGVGLRAGRGGAGLRAAAPGGRKGVGRGRVGGV